MSWKLAHPLEDMDDIIMIGEQYWSVEGLSVLKKDREYFRQCLTVSCTNQLFDKNREFIAIERDGDRIRGYCWFDRGGYTTYSKEEISNAKFHHVDLLLPVRQRVRLLNEMLDQHILWANKCGVPIICSTSIRKENDGFMRIHAKRGFEVTGSYAWGRTEDLLKGM
jgi:hypothetical protein